ncbi:MAG TPA: hypothetical protein DCZ69_00955 [Syntrophobacteraceae bacterium]|nr:hypothetical protein [Syntrophobacteraceae bacterium]HBZ56853.1 hypothetical protein [Syntrophobacteraceae bacterium]
MAYSELVMANVFKKKGDRHVGRRYCLFQAGIGERWMHDLGQTSRKPAGESYGTAQVLRSCLVVRGMSAESR